MCERLVYRAFTQDRPNRHDFPVGDVDHIWDLTQPLIMTASLLNVAHPIEPSGEYDELVRIKVNLNKPGAGGRRLYLKSSGFAVKVGHF